jgi:hypothetical protein
VRHTSHPRTATSTPRATAPVPSRSERAKQTQKLLEQLLERLLERRR